jgi:hypothetical protein
LPGGNHPYRDRSPAEVGLPGTLALGVLLGPRRLGDLRGGEGELGPDVGDLDTLGSHAPNEMGEVINDRRFALRGEI